MAITRAQQAKQMLQDGGRTGFRIGSGEGKDVSGREYGGTGKSGNQDGNGFEEKKEIARQENIRQRALKDLVNQQIKDKKIEKLERFVKINDPTRKITRLFNKIPGLTKFGPFNTREYYAERFAPPGFENLSLSKQNQMFSDYMASRNMVDDDDDEGGIAQIPVDTTFAQAPVEEEKDYYSGRNPFDINRVAYRLMADGGAVIDDEPRQAYGLGSIVKKAARAVKKVAKSDVGKAALTAAAIYYGGGGRMPFTEAFKTKGFGGFKLSNLFSLKNNPLVSTDGKFSAFKSIGIPTLASYFLTPKEEDEDQELDRGEGLDIPLYRRNPEGFLAPRFRAEGGSINEKEKEPVAKKVMPLIDMDGMEKDYRETGGFVEMGRMEKADDVPARLSKNEFVFTADAVRNAGDGSVDKGAEVMYNMMKNLEAGGEVSEESQGLEGARKMFQTSQRLEEVL